MEPHDAYGPDSDIPEVARVSARLVAALNCEVGGQRGNPDQELVVVTLGEPDGTTDVVALIPEDADRLRMLLESAETRRDSGVPSTLKRQTPLLHPHSVGRAHIQIKRLGTAGYLARLKHDLPSLGDYVDQQLRSLTGSVRRHCASPAAARSLDPRAPPLAGPAINGPGHVSCVRRRSCSGR